MSSDMPGPAGGSSPGPVPPDPQIEYLTDHRPENPRRRTWGIAAAAAVAAAGVVGVGAWGLTQFLSAGPSPATAVPGDALFYVGVDLDPDGGQKIQALRTLRKFPAIEDKLGPGAGDDLRRSIFEGLTKESGCDGLDFGEDIEPWLGSKLGVGAVPGDHEPIAFGVVQVSDQAKARDGVAVLDDCEGGDEATGVAFVGDYMVLAESDEIADGVVADVEDGALSDDDDFRTWVEEAGGDGIVTAYVSAEAPQVVLDSMVLDPEPIADSIPTGPDDEAPTAIPATSTMLDSDEMEKAFDDFEGGAVVARFDDEALQIEMAAGGLPSQVQAGGHSGLTDLPASTAMALGFGVSDTYVEDVIDNLRRSMGSDEVDGLLDQAEAETGLSIPEDLQAILGDGVSVSLDSSVDLAAFFGGASGGQASDFPMGVRIAGDPAEIMPALERVLAATGAEDQGLLVEEGEGAVAVGVAASYLQELAGDGELGEQKRFGDALPDLPEDAGGLYVDFDAGDWLVEAVASSPEADRVQENVEPLSSLGITGAADGDMVHGELRLSTD